MVLVMYQSSLITNSVEALASISALLHDWGKANQLFQNKLIESSKGGDPLRHEWVSCLILKGLILQSGDCSTDDGWLNLLVSQTWNESDIKDRVLEMSDQESPLKNLPPIAQLIAWLVVTHHRLPNLKDESLRDSFAGQQISTLSGMLNTVSCNWGYSTKFDADYRTKLQQCLNFNDGLLSQSQQWMESLQIQATKLIQLQPIIQQALDDGSWRVLAHHARLCLMLGDHYYSSCGKDITWESSVPLFANTDPKNQQLKQQLDEHLVHVSKHAADIAKQLPKFVEDMGNAQNLPKLKNRVKGFEWQDNSVDTIKALRKQHPGIEDSGWFVVNMASTGKGKTIANAKLMQALSADGESLRYVLALGLRTLTLQTGDSYTTDIGLTENQLAVVIGSTAVRELHEQGKAQSSSHDFSIEANTGSESAESLMDAALVYTPELVTDSLKVFFTGQQKERNQAFLYKPVLVCTIDHVIGATETVRGGKYILPYLRLLSSDLVIDEVDDFSTEDLIPISRLVHLAGMLGRKVMVSSATIPPALAEGLYNAYQLGWELHSKFSNKPNRTVAMWVDEFASATKIIDQDPCSVYTDSHDEFVSKRVTELQKQTIKHRSKVVECLDIQSAKEQKQLDGSLAQKYYERIKDQVQDFHAIHHTKDQLTGKKVSFGIVRVANIPPCVGLTQYLLNADWNTDVTPRIMAYHSRQILLMRSEQERHLDSVLKRKEKKGQQPVAFSNPVIRAHIDAAETENVIFVVVATPVAEVGRDHDYDWAVVEPSSFRSIIQLAGRVLRHRPVQEDMPTPNIALMQLNVRGLKNSKVAYTKPGFEMNNSKFRLKTKDLKKLINIENTAINAVPRIQCEKALKPTEQLADLEHAVIANTLTNYTKHGAKTLNAWLNETWFLTGMNQNFFPFRKSSPSIQLFAIPEGPQIRFHEKNLYGEYIDRTGAYKISMYVLNPLEQQRLWLNRSFYDSLCRMSIEVANGSGKIDEMISILSKRYGEIMLPQYDESKTLIYSDQFGLVVKD